MVSSEIDLTQFHLRQPEVGFVNANGMKVEEEIKPEARGVSGSSIVSVIVGGPSCADSDQAALDCWPMVSSIHAQNPHFPQHPFAARYSATTPCNI